MSRTDGMFYGALLGIGFSDAATQLHGMWEVVGVSMNVIAFLFYLRKAWRADVAAEAPR